MELSIMTIDCAPTRMRSTAGHLARGTQGGGGFVEKSLMSSRSASIWRAWPCRSKKLLRRSQGQIGQRSKAHAATLQ